MFNRHGNFWIDFHKDVIVVEKIGQWNEETTLDCIREVDLAIESLKGKPFAIIYDSRQFNGMTIESQAIWGKGIKNWSEKNQKATVRVDDEKRSIYKIFLSKFDRNLKARMNFSFSGSVSFAIKSLFNEGFEGFETKSFNVDDFDFSMLG